MKYLMQRQLGFSLVEIMVGMTLGLFLTIGIIQLYIGSNRNYRFQDAFTNTQANGRFALEVLNNSIRMTNFIGCSASGRDNPATSVHDPTPPTVTNVLNTNTDWWKNVSTGWNEMLRGYDGNANDFPGKAFRTSIPGDQFDRIEGTDAIISLGGIGSYSVTAADAQSLTLAQINKPYGGSIQRGDILLVCNVTNVVLFQVTNVAGTGPFVITHANSGTTPGNSSNDFPALPPSPTPIVFSPNINNVYETEVTEYVPTAFYIGVSSSGTSRSLYQIRLEVTGGVASMQPQEMVEGVENMQIFYVENNEYKDASNVINWASVTSVRIELLLASMEDNVLSEPQTYFFPNDTGDSAVTGRIVTANDRRWYQVFSTTVGIRNRLDLRM